MPNHYKSVGNPAAGCYGTPIPPDLGDGPAGGPPPFQLESPMVSPSDPFQPCGPSGCPPPSCCGGGKSASGGSNGGGGLNGGGGSSGGGSFQNQAFGG
jgi:hypothetical protein